MGSRRRATADLWRAAEEALDAAPGQHSDDVTDEEVEHARSLAASVGPSLDDLAALMLIESVKGFGPQKFKELYVAGVSPRELTERPESLPTGGKRGDDFKRAISRFTVEDEDLARRRAARQIVRAQENEARIVTFDDPSYPENVWESNNPIPILYVQGSSSALRERSNVACVGSRKNRAPYVELLDQFARAAVDSGFGVVSGFALGADSIAHRAAFEAGGRTVAVMPCGLDRPFPPENRPFWDDLRRYPGAIFVSEFPFGTAASGLTLRKRNKLIVAFALGVLVAQSAANGGAMNAYRFALEQRKPAAAFRPDLQGDTSGNALIIEEAERRQASLAAPVDAALPADRDTRLWRDWLHALSSSI